MERKSRKQLILQRKCRIQLSDESVYKTSLAKIYICSVNIALRKCVREISWLVMLSDI